MAKAIAESWPYFLLTAYVVFLLGSFFKFPTLLAEEFKMFGWYFVVGMLAAISLFPPFEVGEGWDINLFGLFRNVWYEAIFPFALAFMAFSLPRLLIVIFIDWRKRKQCKQQTT